MAKLGFLVFLEKMELQDSLEKEDHQEKWDQLDQLEVLG